MPHKLIKGIFKPTIVFPCKLNIHVFRQGCHSFRPLKLLSFLSSLSYCSRCLSSFLSFSFCRFCNFPAIAGKRLKLYTLQSGVNFFTLKRKAFFLPIRLSCTVFTSFSLLF